MMDSNDLRDWTAEWQRSEEHAPPGDALKRHVERRSALLATWVVLESAVAVVATVALLYLWMIRPDPAERLVVGTLILACIGAAGFGWWNWRGSFRAIGETTTIYLDLATARLVRLRRALVAGWVLLAVEMAAFVPWVWYRTRLPAGGGDPVIWPWVLLATMGLSATLWLVILGRWVKREGAIVDELRREYGDR